MKKIEIHQIPFDLAYEGYYWYSNASKPIVLRQETISEALFTTLPFIIEGNLYNEVMNISIHIKNIDGKYWITQANLNDVNPNNMTEKTYLPHDLNLKGIKKIKLVHYWQESEPDELLAGMRTLVPVWMAFKGFVK